MQISVADTSFTGKVIQRIDLNFETTQVCVKDIITARVTHEVEAYNRRQDRYFQGLVMPAEAEQILNGYRLKSKQPIDAEKQVYIALQAFQQGAYFVLVDDIQVEHLEETLELTPNTQISFIKLTPLVGG